MDPIADMLTTIRNNMAAGNDQAMVLHSKQKLAILQLLKLKQIIADFEVEEIELKKMINIFVLIKMVNIVLL